MGEQWRIERGLRG